MFHDLNDPRFAELISVANAYGSDPEYSRAGGGNASVKIDGVLYIKPSGVPLATLQASDLVPLRIDVLLEALHSDAEVEGDPVRAAAEAAQIGDGGGRRPSVEILFHALIPDTLVLHSHPLVANAVGCNVDADRLVADLFGDDAILVPYIDPGVPLARGVEAVRTAYEARTGVAAPGIALLANHGIIISGETADDIRERTERLTGAVGAALDATPTPEAPALDPASARALIDVVAPTLRAALATDAGLATVVADTSDLARTPSAIHTEGPLIPDQIVYSGSFPLVIDVDDPTTAASITLAALADFRATHGRDPVVAVIPGIGAFGSGKDWASASNALLTFTDALRVAADADRLGRVRTLDATERGFIENWEAESYRKGMAARKTSGRLTGKVVMVTGAAQGFGLGIATELLGEGAHVVLADLNVSLASQNAAELSARFGPGRAQAVRVDVSDEQSCLDAVHEVVRLFGGLDVFISNAGVVRSAGVMEQVVSDFDLVTNVNYRGYFLGVRAVAPVLAAQHAVRPDDWFDIIEINSKSGLEGSKANFAYAGSKFGGIGLTQSFALELVDHGIKVNAVCPGNYLDGPLWMDPERGLFVQYLRAGKVPGAVTVADVRKFYEDKVPMRRGCQPADLAQAIYYIVAQTYETGQALPVTGGQVMLS